MNLLNVIINKEFRRRHWFALSLCLLFAFFCPAGIAPAIGQMGNQQAGLEMVLKDIPLETALKILAERHGYAFSSATPMPEKVNLDARGVSFEDSVRLMLAGRPYNWAKENNTLKIFKAVDTPTNFDHASDYGINQSFQEVAEPVKKKILVLSNRRPDEMVELLKPLAEEVKLMADIRTNSILMSGPETALKTVEKMAQDLDKIQTIKGLEDKREFLSEVFSLDYISDFEDLEQNLNFILYGSAQAMSENNSQSNQNGTIAGRMIDQPVIPVRKEYYLLDKVRRLLMITASRDKMEIIREFFNRVNTPLPQVLIEAHIVAIDDGFQKSAGINWNFSGSYQGPTRPTDRPLGAPEATVGGTTIDPTQGFQFGQWNLSSLLATLELAQSKNKGKILSQPKLMTLSGNEARIVIGTRYPYKASTTLNQSGGTAENIQYVDVGIILNVTPQVNTKSGTIVMNLAPEVSDVVGFRNDAPIITSRQTSTVVEVADGKTVVIGGLLRDEDLKSRNGVPILREIPVLGEFFRFSNKNRNKTNLVIMITPKVVDVRGHTKEEAKVEQAKERIEAQKTPVKRKKLRNLVESLREKYKED